jgi:hypothetical protein
MAQKRIVCLPAVMPAELAFCAWISMQAEPTERTKSAFRAN